MAELKELEYKYPKDYHGIFEDLSTLMFCTEIGLTYGVNRRINQYGIESEPVIMDSKVYAFQAKYYESSTTLALRKNDLIKSIKAAREKNVSHLMIFINKDLPDTDRQTNEEVSYLRDINNVARNTAHPIVIDWWTKSKIETSLDLPKFKAIRDRYFNVTNNSPTNYVKSKNIIIPLEGTVYVADYVRSLLSDAYGSWQHIALDYNSGYDLDTEILSNANYFYEYYKENRNRNLNTTAFDQLSIMFGRLLIDAFNNDYEYAIELSKRINRFFEESLGIRTSSLILYEKLGHDANKKRIVFWKNILFEVITYWRRCGEQFLLSELQDHCDFYISLSQKRNRIELSRDILKKAFNNKRDWEYTICIVDDDDEIRHKLHNMLEDEIERNALYKGKIIDYINGNTARIYTRETNCDVMVLDIVNEKPYNLKDDPYNSPAIYFGGEYLNLVLKEKPDSKVATKFFVYSGLERHVAYSEMKDYLQRHNIDISFYTKSSENDKHQDSDQRIVDDIIFYLNDLFYKDIMPNYIDFEIIE